MLQREHACWLRCLNGFHLFSKDGNFKGGIKGGSQQNSHPSSRCVLLGSWSVLIGWCWGGGGVLVTASGPDAGHELAWSGFAAFLGVELKHSRVLDVIPSLTKSLPLPSPDSEALFLRYFDADQNLVAPRA